MPELGYFEIGSKKLYFEKNDFETFYVQNYSQKMCFRSILNRLIHFWGLFYIKKAPSYTFDIFLQV